MIELPEAYAIADDLEKEILGKTIIDLGELILGVTTLIINLLFMKEILIHTRNY